MENAPDIALVTAAVKAARAGYRAPDTQVTRAWNGVVSERGRRPDFRLRAHLRSGDVHGLVFLPGSRPPQSRWVLCRSSFSTR